MSRLSLAVLALAGAVVIAAAPAPPRVGEEAPGFTLLDQNGKRVTLSSAHGHRAVLVFYRGYW